MRSITKNLLTEGIVSIGLGLGRQQVNKKYQPATAAAAVPKAQLGIDLVTAAIGAAGKIYGGGMWSEILEPFYQVGMGWTGEDAARYWKNRTTTTTTPTTSFVQNSAPRAFRAQPSISPFDADALVG